MPKKRNAPWPTKNVIRLIMKRNATFKAARASNSPIQLAKNRKLRNVVTKMIRKTKAFFFKEPQPLAQT